MRAWALLMCVIVFTVPVTAAGMAPGSFATAGHTDQPPTIDGKLDDPCWGPECLVLGDFVLPDMSDFAPAQTTARICYDDSRLHMAVVCEEPNVAGMKAFHTERDTALWRDDCVEIFIDTNHDRATFHQFIVNSKGAIYDKPPDGDASWDSGAEAAALVGEERWTIEISIPFSDLGGAVKPGDVWGFEIGRERYAGEGHLSVWSPTYGKFHEADKYGELTFGQKAAGVTHKLPSVGFGLNGLSLTTQRPLRPRVQILSRWPVEVKRDWMPGAPEVTATPAGQAHVWSAGYRIADGSEAALVITQEDAGELLYRKSLPLRIEPEPITPTLAQALLGLERRASSGGQFARETQGLLAQARAELDEFITGNLQRSDAMSPASWAAVLAEHKALYARVADLAYIVWTKSPLEGLDRHEMPPTASPPDRIELTACCNERESANIIITNLRDSQLEARVSLRPLTLMQEMRAGDWEAPNLLQNPQFALDHDDDGIPDGWYANARQGLWSLDAQPDGSRAFALSAPRGKAGSVNFRQKVVLKPGQRYTLLADVSTESLPPSAGHLHVINGGWTWATGIDLTAINSPRTTYRRSFTAPQTGSFEVVLRLVTENGGVIRYHSVGLIEGGVEDTTFAADCIRLHDVAFQSLRTGAAVADPLPIMSEGRIVSVPPGQSRQVWLSMDTSHLPPGRYAGSIAVTPFDRSLRPRSVPLRIHIRPVRLPDRMPIAVYNWDYAKGERYVSDLAAHRNNTFLINTSCRASFDKEGNVTGPVDWSSYDKMLQVKLRYARRHGGIILFSYGIVRDFHTKFSKAHGWEFMGPAWRKAFKTWVLEFERHLREDLGMQYDEYAVQLWDEATGANADLTVRAGEFMRGFAPSIRTCMDGAQNMAEVTALDPVIDLWIPHQNTLYAHKEKAELRKLYADIMAKGEPVWTYTCSTNMKALAPLDYYRLKEWRVWDLGLQGSCYWAYNSWRGDPWNDFDGNIADCGAIYDGPEGPVTSRRWEATLDGREDYLYLHMLNAAAAKADPQTRAGIEAFISESVATVLGSPRDVGLFEGVRDALGDALQKHCGANPPRVLQGPDFVVNGNQITCSWRTDIPAQGSLYYRIPGDARWSALRFESGERHVGALVDLTPYRDLEWYLISWSSDGATAGCLDGLTPEAWLRTQQAVD